MISFNCPSCKTQLSREDHEAGNKFACPGCGQRLQVPAPQGAAAQGAYAPRSEGAALDHWYVARKKEKKGPYTLGQLKELAAACQILPTDMVNQEGTPKWVVASTVPGLFPLPPPESPFISWQVPDPVAPKAVEVPQPKPVVEIPRAEAAIQPESVWHYTQNGKRHGPVTWEQVTHLAQTGRLQPTDLLWEPGMAGWQQAQSFPGLFPQAVPVLAPADRALPRQEYPNPMLQRSHNSDGLPSFILGLVSLLLIPILGPVAIYLANRSLQANPKDGYAKGGLIMGWIASAVCIFFLCIIGGLFALALTGTNASTKFSNIAGTIGTSS